MRRILLVAAAILILTPAPARRKRPNPAPPVKVACVGNSITYGMKLENRERDSYPAQLQELLGSAYEVGNFGKSGATLLRQGHRPYMEQEEFRQAMAFAGDIVVIHLGVNDTDPRNWPHLGDRFAADYLALIDSLRHANPKARFFLARMTPIGSNHPRFLSGTRDWHGKIQKEIELVAHATGARLIDFFEPLHPFPWLFPDEIHPDTEGAAVLARSVYRAITGDFGGLQMPALYSDNMVLPREKIFRINGMADAGEQISVTLGGRSYTALAGTDGRWDVDAGPFPAGEGAQLTVKSPRKALHFRNVAFGDIWLCSGQSNMAFELRQSVDADPRSDAGLRLYDMKARWRTDDVAWPAEALDSVAHLHYFEPTAWTLATDASLERFSAVAYAFGAMLRDSLQVPVGLVCNAVGGSTAESWIDRESLEAQYPAILRDWLHNDLIMEWARGRAEKNLSLRPGKAEGYTVVPTRHPYEPCYLFEAGILPLDRFPFTGVIWYQGESNAERMEVHERLFPLLVDSWRSYFESPQLPFYYVQLSSLNRSCWPVFRDSQRRLATCREGLGMAVSSDLGDSLDVHPRLKKPIGERLALQALEKYYGHPLKADGPRVQGIRREGECLVLLFDQPLAKPDGSLRGFEVLDGATARYEAVSAAIDGCSVRLDVRSMAEPLAVRYGWEAFTRANLTNLRGLPASTFKLTIASL